MWENNKKIIIGVVLLLALANVVVVSGKVILPREPSQPSPFQQQQQQAIQEPGSVYYNPDNGRMSLLPQTQPFVTAPESTKQYGGKTYETPQEPYKIPVQDYGSWSNGWERSRSF